jgi:glycosyltransferase involved in cell wall biosynthesis
MRIIIVSRLPMEGQSIKGGVESVVLNLLQGFSGYKEISVLVLSFNSSIEQIVTRQLYENVIIKYIPFGRIKSSKFEYLFHAKRIVNNLAEDFQADLIHIQGNGSILLLFNENFIKKTIVTQHGILKEEIKYLKNLRAKTNHLLNILIESYYIKKIENWIFISKYNKSIAVHRKFKFGNIAHIFNPVASIYFSQGLLNNQKANSLYYVGSITRRKGLLDLIEAINQMNERGFVFNLKVFGGFIDKNYKKIIFDYIKRNKLDSQIEFFGWRKAEEIIELTADIPVFVLPSYQETLPVVVAEAMAMGKIVVATNIAGIPEMIVDGINGFLYDKGDKYQLANILCNLSNSDKTYINNISNKAKEYAISKFSLNSVADQTINFYKEVLTNK